MGYDIDALREDVSKRLKKKRYTHSLGVMFTAQALAMKYDVPLEDAAVAGILHDCAKEMSDGELLSYCKKHGIYISDSEKKAPYLLHGKAGAYMAKKKYGVKEEYILDAIRFHTTGRPMMTMLEKIVFTADYIEPGRKNPAGRKGGPGGILPAVRKEAFTDLDRACAMIMKNTIDYLRSDESRHIDNTSIEAYGYYKAFL